MERERKKKNQRKRVMWWEEWFYWFLKKARSYKRHFIAQIKKNIIQLLKY